MNDVTPIAEIQGATVRYGARTALADVSLTVPGGAIGLLGYQAEYAESFQI